MITCFKYAVGKNKATKPKTDIILKGVKRKIRKGAAHKKLKKTKVSM